MILEGKNSMWNTIRSTDKIGTWMIDSIKVFYQYNL